MKYPCFCLGLHEDYWIGASIQGSDWTWLDESKVNPEQRPNETYTKK